MQNFNLTLKYEWVEKKNKFSDWLNFVYLYKNDLYLQK